MAGRGSGRSPETGSRSSKHAPGRGIGSNVESFVEILKRQSFIQFVFKFLSRHKSVRKMFSHPI